MSLTTIASAYVIAAALGALVYLAAHLKWRQPLLTALVAFQFCNLLIVLTSVLSRGAA